MNNTKNKNFRKRDIIYITVIALLFAATLTFFTLFEIANVKKSDQQEYYDNKIVTFSFENSNFAKGQIVFIGDSITDMCFLDEYYSDLDLAVYNRGISADTTKGVLERLKVSAFDIEPSKIVLMIGANDVNFGVPYEETVSNYRKILDEIKKNQPEVELYAMSITPQNKKIEESGDCDAATNNDIIESLNLEIEMLCVEYGYTYIDLYSYLRDGTGYLRQDCSTDGLHLNKTGYEVWAKLIKPYLEK